MKKIIVTVISLFLVHVFPALIFAQGQSKETAMDSTYSVYMLLFLLLVLFTAIIFYASPGNDKEPLKIVVKEEVIYNRVLISSSGVTGILKSLNAVYYAVCLLLAIYLIMLVSVIL